MLNDWRKWFRGAVVALLALGCACTAAADEADEIKITRTATDIAYRNPTLYFAGIPGDANLEREVRTLLEASGWFTLVDDRNYADYLLRGGAANGVGRVELSIGGSVKLDQSASYSPASPRSGAKTLADAVLAAAFGQRFGVKGVCSSRIVFCVEPKPGQIDIYTCDIDGANLVKLTDYKDMVVEPSWFPDGKSIVYTKYNRTTTSIMQTELGSKRTRILGTYPGTNIGAAISPDGRRMTLVMSKDRQVDLYVRAVEGGDLLRLTNNNDVEASPSWEADGSRICFASGAYAGGKIYYVGSRGGNRLLLPNQQGDSVKPNWSRDGKIVYSTKRDGKYVLAVYDTNYKSGTPARFQYEKNGLVMDRNPGGSWESASWAPDNRHVVCSNSDGKTATLVIVDTWTGKRRKLAPIAGRLLMPSWSPLQK